MQANWNLIAGHLQAATLLQMDVVTRRFRAFSKTLHAIQPDPPHYVCRETVVDHETRLSFSIRCF
jgi:hypothetical protein